MPATMFILSVSLAGLRKHPTWEAAENIPDLPKSLIWHSMPTYLRSIVAQKNWTVLSFLTMVNSIKGSGYGLKGQELTKVNPVSDLVNGTKSYISTLLKILNWKSGGYLVATLFFVSSNFPNCCKYLKCCFEERGALNWVLDCFGTENLWCC